MSCVRTAPAVRRHGRRVRRVRGRHRWARPRAQPGARRARARGSRRSPRLLAPDRTRSPWVLHLGPLDPAHLRRLPGDRPQRPRHPLRRGGPRRDLVAGAQDRARAAAVDRRAHGAAGPGGRGARRGDRGLRGGRRQGRPRQHRRARAGHPPRREGAHRGVLRARRARAHPQGHDLARPDRERRAAAGPRLARPAARPRVVATLARLGAAGHRARVAGDGRALAQRGRPGDHARQAVRHGRRRDAGRARAARRPARRATRCAASRGRWAPPRTCSTCWTGRRASLAELEQRVARAPRLRAGADQRRPGLPALARLRRRLRAGAAGRRARPTWPPRSG